MMQMHSGGAANVYPTMRENAKCCVKPASSWLHCYDDFCLIPVIVEVTLPLRIQKMANPDSELGVPDQSF